MVIFYRNCYFPILSTGGAINMGTPICSTLYIFSGMGKMHLFRFLPTLQRAVTYIICVSQHKREGRDSYKVITINSPLRGSIFYNSARWNLNCGMPIVALIKVEGDKKSNSCIWYRKDKNERFCHP